MNLFYDALTRRLYIDENMKQTVLQLPEEMNDRDARDFIQSDTLYAIIEQLLRSVRNE